MARTAQHKTAEPAAEEQQDPVASDAAPAGAASRALTPTHVLGLQQSGGNQMVQRVLAVARQTATAGNKIDQLDEMLDRFNVPEDEVIALLGTLSAAEKATVLSGGYKDKIADALDTGEMVRAVDNLGPALSVKLDWVSAAAGGAGDIDYSDIKAMIVAAPQDQRDALKSSPWRDFFVDVCTNATMPEAVADLRFDLATKLDWMGEEISLDYGDIKQLIVNAPQAERDVLKTRPWRDWFVGVCTNATMAEAVVDLAFDLATKLKWMVEEGTNLDLVGSVIRNTPAADLPAAAADTAMLDLLRDELGDEDYGVAHRMLTAGLLGETTVENETDTGNEYEALVALSRSGLTISKDVEFVEEGTFGAGGFAALKARIIAAVTTYMTGKFKVKIQSVGTPREGDGEYPISVLVNDNAGADYPLRLHGGEHGRSGVDEDGGDIYELGQASETSAPDVMLAHECAHMILGASDEYANASVSGRVVYTDNSLLGDFYAEGMAAAHIKARHFQFLVNTVAQWFPGRTITIVP
jgi:hypothetical protein